MGSFLQADSESQISTLKLNTNRCNINNKGFHFENILIELCQETASFRNETYACKNCVVLYLTTLYSLVIKMAEYIALT